MNPEIEIHPCDVQEEFKLPSERLIRRFPAIASLAALYAAISTTKIAISCDHPSIRELLDMLEDGDEVSRHLFIAHNIIYDLEALRLTIDCYFQHANAWAAQFKTDPLPF